MKKRWYWLPIAAVVLLGLWAMDRFRFTSHATTEAGPGEVRERVIAEAVVSAVGGVAEVRARTDGRIVAMRVREGDYVHAGQLLAEIDSEELRLITQSARAEQAAMEAHEQAVRTGSRPEQIQAAAAEHQASEAALAIAEDDLKRAVELHAGSAIAAQQLFATQQRASLARAAVEQARAQRALTVSGSRREDVLEMRARVAAARVRAEQAELRLGWTRVVAPIDGVVVGRLVDEGDTVTTSPSPTLLFEVADTDQTELMAEIEETDAISVTTGLDVVVTRPGGRERLATARLARVNARVRPRTIGASLARVRAETSVRPVWARWTDLAGPKLPLGMRVEAVITLPPKNVKVRAPRAAIEVRDGEAVLRTQGLFFARNLPVSLGAADDQFVEVLGVEPGLKVLLNR
jgi:multidrug efflux pump subunit AcrA (membrane-fusion protein)